MNTRLLRKLAVCRIFREEKRTLVYGQDEGYHLIGTKEARVTEGDVVQYEPCGVNFGWLVETP